MEKEKTLIDLVDDIITTLNLANDRMGALRDAVEESRLKGAFNSTRAVLQTELLPMWYKYRDALPESVANKPLGSGWTGRCKWPKPD